MDQLTILRVKMAKLKIGHLAPELYDHQIYQEKLTFYYAAYINVIF